MEEEEEEEEEGKEGRIKSPTQCRSGRTDLELRVILLSVDLVRSVRFGSVDGVAR